MKMCKVSPIACVAAALLFMALSCNGTSDVPTGYRIPSIIKTYLVFGNSSRWEYEIDSSGKLEHVELEEIENGIDRYRDAETVKYKLKSDNTEWVEAYIGGQPQIVMMGENYQTHYISSNNAGDSLRVAYYLDSAEIKNKIYYNVAVSVRPDLRLKEIWLAPKVGIIKKVYNNGSVYLLKNYEIK